MAALSPPRPPSLREGGAIAGLACLLVVSPAIAQDGVPRGESGAVKKEQPGDAPADKRQAPRVLTYVSPVYPEEAKKQGIEGDVSLELSIDADGKVTSA